MGASARLEDLLHRVGHFRDDAVARDDYGLVSGHERLLESRC